MHAYCFQKILYSSSIKALFDISGRREASEERGNGHLEQSTGAPPTSVKTPNWHPFTPAVLARSSPNSLSPARSGRNGAPPECQTDPKTMGEQADAVDTYGL
ncbi:hypothetical protein KSP39_PZI011441 [Platanthera zijinensis]|uniref:Uncharacterized protein n=1 Tax=Platanthera zijinensis TaxID=2320716 RepID=A0AAP0BIL7_9ASPA